MKSNIKNNIRKYSAMGLCLAFLFPGVSYSMDMGALKVGGTFMGVLNTMTPSNERSQFDFATNLDFEFQLDDNIKGIVQIQSGPGKGSLGFVGPAAEVTDINIEYTHESDTTITLGSYDLPFGKGVAYLTNNGDAFQSPFLMNSLTYSALAGPVGTLNTLGINVHKEFSMFETTLSVTNGTGEDAINHGKEFLYLLSVGSDKLLPGLYIGASYTQSDDSKDPKNEAKPDESTNGFQSNFKGWIVDANYDVNDTLTFRSHVGMITYGDGDSATDDDVMVLKLESKYQLSKYFVAVRYSSWMPKDDNGNGSGMSSKLATPGLAGDTGLSDTSISRIQVGGGYELQENLVARAEVFIDKYKKGDDYKGIVLFLNGRF